MTSAGTLVEEAVPPGGAPDHAAAVLYVCADRNQLMPGLAAQRAEEEGRAFALEHGLAIAEVVRDRYGEPDPCRRPGWRRVRELAGAGTAAVVLARWPASIAPDSSAELRHREVRWLAERGVRVRYTWAPLVGTIGGEAG